MTKKTQNFLFVTAGIVIAMVAGLAIGYGYASEKAKQEKASADNFEYLGGANIEDFRVEELQLLQEDLKALFDAHKKLEADCSKIEKLPRNAEAVESVKFYGFSNSHRLEVSLSMIQFELEKRQKANKK